MDSSINLLKCLSFIAYQNCTAKFNGYSIPIICVESPILTASYYKEYLGFGIIYRSPMNRNSSVLIKKNSNWVLIKPIDSKKPICNQKLVLYSHRIDKEYSQLCNKVLVVKPFNSDLKEKFLIKDCNGMEIAFCSR